MTEFLAFVAVIPLWAYPTALTAILWAFMLFLPVDGPTNVMDFGPALVSLFRLVIGVVGTLVFWMVYFALT